MLRLVEESGFCHGVSAAVHRARGLAGRTAVYLLGDLANNRQVMAGFRRDGFIVAEESAAEVARGAAAVIRAHGVGRAVYAELAARGVEIVDCTCVKVKKIHEIVAEKSAAGFRVIIIGKKNHPEVLGILGWCGNGGGVVAENEGELAAALKAGAPRLPLCVVAQTTCSKDWWEKAVAIILEKPDAEIFDTLCDVTSRRIKNAVELAKKSACMVVVGDKKSANSMELFAACKAVRANTVFVSSLADMAENMGTIIGAGDIGIAGGASTPMELIEEIHEFLLFADFISRAKTEIETASEKYFNGLIRDAEGIPFIADALRDLRFQNQGGKRVRGALIMLGYALASGLPVHGNTVLSVALAYEIFSTAILIHDDIIDKSPTRRGKKTIHAARGDGHFAMSRAICIGDYGLFLAAQVMANAGLDAPVFSKAMRFFSEIQVKTLQGELMDISLPQKPVKISKKRDDYSLAVGKIYEFKTAWYTLAGPLMLGALCGGAGDDMLNELRETAIPLGLAFQIKDDLLGIFANEKTLGKPALSDIIEKKQTLLYGYALKHCTREQKILLEKHYGNPDANKNSLKIVRGIFKETGAKAACEAEILKLNETAIKKIKGLQIPEEYRKLLRGLVHFLTIRGY